MESGRLARCTSGRRQVRSARLGPIGRDGRAPGGRVAHRLAFGSAARVVGRAGGVRRTTPRRREPPSAVGLCRPDAQAGCRRHWACDIPSIASTTRYAGRVARTARRRGQRAAHERLQVRRGGPRRVAGTTKCRPHVWHVGSGSSCTARLLASTWGQDQAAQRGSWRSTACNRCRFGHSAQIVGADASPQAQQADSASAANWPKVIGR